MKKEIQEFQGEFDKQKLKNEMFGLSTKRPRREKNLSLVVVLDLKI